jgi:hypothetical protein
MRSPGFAARGEEKQLDRQRQHSAVPQRGANPSAAHSVADVEKNAARPIAELVKAGVPADRLKEEIRDAVEILRHHKVTKGPFLQLWGLPNRRALSQLIADLRLRAEQIERLNKSIAGSQMRRTFPWLDRSKGRQDWKLLEQTTASVPGVLRAYASCIEACYGQFRRTSRLKKLRPEEIFEHRLVELVNDSTGSPHWGNVSALLYWIYETTGIEKKTSEDTVRKRHRRPGRRTLHKAIHRKHRTL